MQAIIQLVIRMSGFLAFLLLLLAVENGWFVCEGLWQGSGLHGFTDNMNNKYGFFIVWTWDAFIRMLVFFGLAALFGLITLQKYHALKRTATPRRRGKTPLRGVKTKSTRK
jgi:hypothetical protein